MALDISWLNHSVPLWVFLLALLTAPAEWAKRARKRLGPLIDRILP